MVTFAQDLVLGVRPFTAQQDGDDVIIGNAQTGVFLAVPPEAAELLQQLARGRSVGEVSKSYEQKYGQAPDLDDFISLLEAKGFVEFPGSSGAPLVVERRYHFGNFPQRLAQRLFSTPAVVASLLLIALALIAIGIDHSLVPGPADIVFTDHRAVTWAILVILDLLMVFIHEFAHLVAARAQGVTSRMGLGNRLWNLVAETDLTGLWAVPKNKRYLPMVAGMLVDGVSAAVLILLVFAQHNHHVLLPAFCLRLIRALTVGYLLRIVWEFCLFVRTDVYYVVANFFHCKNLLADTEAFLRNQLSRLVPSIDPIDQSAVPESEMRMIRYYAFFWIGGRIWAIFMLFWMTIPVSVGYIRDLSHVFRAGYLANPWNFIDGALIATIFLTFTLAGFILWVHRLVIRQRS